MDNAIHAHIFGRRMLGDREEVKMLLFNPDGTPFELSGVPEEPSEPTSGGGSATGTMIYRGGWDPSQDYKQYDVVVHNPGSGLSAYIFDEDVPSGVPSMDDQSTPPNPVKKFWDASNNSIELTINADSFFGAAPRGPGLYDCFAIKIDGAGNLSLTSKNKLDLNIDMYGIVYRRQANGSWQGVSWNDDGAGNGHPLITLPVTPGVYLYSIGPYAYSDPNQEPYYETAVVSRVDPATTAVIGSFAAFPVAKTTQL